MKKVLPYIEKAAVVFFVLIFLAFAVLIVHAVLTLYKNGLEDFFKEWNPTVDSDVAIIDGENETFLVNGEALESSDALEKYFSSYYSQDSLVFADGIMYVARRTYFKSEGEIYIEVKVCGINFKTGEDKIIYVENYCVDEGAPSTLYYDGKIYICDGVKTIEIDIGTLTVEEFPADYFLSLPKKYEVRIETSENEKIIDEKVVIRHGDAERELMLSYFAENNEYIKKIVDSANDIRFNRNGFFQKSYVVNDKIYLFCCVLDRDGESNGILFSYDYITEEILFIYHSFSSEHSDIRVVPCI